MTGRELVLARHGETDWSRSGQHTSRTDLELTAAGEEQAVRLGRALAGRSFALVLTSPLRRARRTAELAGFGTAAVVEDDLREWDYGIYEGRTTSDISQEVPGWTVWTHPLPGGELADDVGARVDRVLERVRAVHERGGDAIVFGHGHCLRILAARWVGLAAIDGRRFALSTATLSTLGHERDTPVFVHWNQSVDGEEADRAHPAPAR
jgi:broad specificity phosphatase PhoE